MQGLFSGIGAVLLTLAAVEVLMLYFYMPPRRQAQARISAPLFALAGIAAFALGHFW